MIRKRKIEPVTAASNPGLALEDIATFEVTSEKADHPLENILRNDAKVWRAAETGEQTIRILFDAPQQVARIILRFDEHEESRTQEFAIYRETAEHKVWTEVRRQQFNFSPPGTTTEFEEFQLALPHTVKLEFVIKPSIFGGGTATLTHLAIFSV